MRLTRFLLLPAIMLFSGLSQANAATDPGAVIYKNECSACHIAYPTQFLSTRSWDVLIKNLADHFGDNAELAPQDTAALKSFLDNNNYDQSRIKRRYGNRFDTQGAPLRISETRFFRAIHHEISDRYVTQNPKVKSYANCAACHRGAERGNFDEDEVRVPR